jgi:hypothetical protein
MLKKNKQDFKRFPKVVILTRAELLAGVPEYHASFVPLELDDVDKDEVHEGLLYFDEIRIAPFNVSQRDEYIRAAVALKVRKEFELCVGAIEPLDVGERKLDDVLFSSLPDNVLRQKTIQSQLKYTLRAATIATTHPSSDREDARSKVVSLLKELYPKKQEDAPVNLHSHVPAIELLVALCKVVSQVGRTYGEKSILQTMSTRLKEGNVWTSAQFDEALLGLRELEELLTTPFMIKIVVTILPLLQGQMTSPDSVKAELILLTNDGLAGRLFAKLRSARIADSTKSIQKVQLLLDGNTEESSGFEFNTIESLQNELASIAEAIPVPKDKTQQVGFSFCGSSMHLR